MKQQAVISAVSRLVNNGFNYFISPVLLWIQVSHYTNEIKSNTLCITNSYHTLLFRKKMRFLFYVLLIFSVVSCSLNAIILNLIFGVCCSFLVLLNLLIILFHDLFFHAKIIDLSTKKMSSVKKHKIVFHLTSILLFLHISFTTTSFILASIIFKGKNQFPYFLFH